MRVETPVTIKFVRVEIPETFKVFVLTSEVDTPAVIPVSCDPSPLKDVAVNIPVTTAPVFVVTNLLVLLKLSCTPPPPWKTARVALPAAFLILTLSCLISAAVIAPVNVVTPATLTLSKFV